MRNTIQYLINIYNTNTVFHSLVLALEQGLISYLILALASPLPSTKDELIGLGVGLGSALTGALKRWLQENVATVPVETKTMRTAP